jgi:hypothetical protein
MWVKKDEAVTWPPAKTASVNVRTVIPLLYGDGGRYAAFASDEAGQAGRFV